jgi:site-specific recombinase XerD
MTRWQLYTGLRVGELLRLTGNDVLKHQVSRRSSAAPPHHIVEVLRKGRKNGYVIAADSLLQETSGYLSEHRTAWIKRGARRRHAVDHGELFINSWGRPVKKNSYQQVIADIGDVCGFRATTHLLRSTFACMMLARLERLARQARRSTRC